MAGVGNIDGDEGQGTYARPDSRRAGTLQMPADVDGAYQRQVPMLFSMLSMPGDASRQRCEDQARVRGQDDVLSATEAHRARLDSLPMLGRKKRR